VSKIKFCVAKVASMGMGRLQECQGAANKITGTVTGLGWKCDNAGPK
jgi:hypothetical protein